MNGDQLEEGTVVNLEIEKAKGSKLSLDQYLNSHTSEDNESFEDLVIQSDKKHKEKYAFFYKDEEFINEAQKNMLALPSIEDQAKSPKKTLNVGTWGYKNRNFIMFNPDGVPLTEEQELELKNKKQEIAYDNTRLIASPFNEVQSKETITDLAKNQAKVSIENKQFRTQFVLSCANIPEVVQLLSYSFIPFDINGKFQILQENHFY